MAEQETLIKESKDVTTSDTKAPETEGLQRPAPGPKKISPPAELAKIPKMPLAEKLLMIEEEMPEIPKTGQNLNDKGEVRYTFREAEQVVKTISPLLVKYRVKVLALMEDHKLHNRSGWDKTAMQEVSRGTKAVVKFTFRFLNVDDPKDTLDIPWVAEGDDFSDKGTNKAATIAQKNMYMRLFNIADDDPDAQTLESAGLQSPTKTVSNDKITILNTMLRRLKISPDDFEAKQKKPIEKMTNAEADDAISRMEAVISRQLALEAAAPSETSNA